MEYPLIIVIYSSDLELCKIFTQKLRNENKENVKYFIIQTLEGETRVECLNPKLVSEEEYLQARKIIEKCEKLMNDKINK